MRALVMDGLEFLGVKYDAAVNAAPERGAVTVPCRARQPCVKLYIIPTNEELVIARETLALSHLG